MRAQSGRLSHPFLWSLVVIAAAAAMVAAYLVLGPKATDFAGGKRVALADYRQQDPTGVPAELKSSRSDRAWRIPDARSGLCRVPYRSGRRAVRRRARLCTAFRDDVFDQHHSRRGDRHRQLYRCELPGCHTQGHRPQPHQTLSGDAVCELHLYVRYGCARNQILSVLVETSARLGAGEQSGISLSISAAS